MVTKMKREDYFPTRMYPKIIPHSGETLGFSPEFYARMRDQGPGRWSHEGTKIALRRTIIGALGGVCDIRDMARRRHMRRHNTFIVRVNFRKAKLIRTELTVDNHAYDYDVYLPLPATNDNIETAEYVADAVGDVLATLQEHLHMAVQVMGDELNPLFVVREDMRLNNACLNDLKCTKTIRVTICIPCGQLGAAPPDDAAQEADDQDDWLDSDQEDAAGLGVEPADGI